MNTSFTREGTTMSEIPEDIDNIASAIVRAQFAEDDDAEWGMYLLIAKAILAERGSNVEERDRLREENERLRGADQIVDKIEALFPDWRAYRDLVDCIECTLYRLRKEYGREA
jgi:hypothetical protein